MMADELGQKEITLPNGSKVFPSDAVEDQINSLQSRIDELEECEEELEDLQIEYQRQEDYKDYAEDRDIMLRTAIQVMRGVPQDLEVSHSGLITDVEGFISAIEWELKG